MVGGGGGGNGGVISCCFLLVLTLLLHWIFVSMLACKMSLILIRRYVGKFFFSYSFSYVE